MENLITITEKQNEILGNIKNEFQALEKVKALVLYDGMQVQVTPQQVADYYEVSRQQIDNLIKSSENELTSDNSKIRITGDYLKKFKKEHTDILINLGSQTNLPTYNPFVYVPSLTLLTFRSVIRIGMMLQKSPIAKKLRDVLLDNLQEETTKESISMNISEEQVLQLAIFSAKGDSARMDAICKLNEFKDRHIGKLKDEVVSLEEDKTVLIDEVNTWESLLGQKNVYNFKELAKFFNSTYKKLPNGKTMGRNNLFAWMRDEGILMESNEPYQKYSKYFKVILGTYDVTLIYSNGIKWLIKRFEKKLKENNIQ